MFVQWCIKGVNGIDDDEARGIIDNRHGLICRWWRNVETISPPKRREKLTEANLERHVNAYDATDPATGIPFCEGTPFISLASGSVERSSFLQTNITHPAHMVALDFATRRGDVEGYLFYCWVIVGIKTAPTVESVAEEVRELNTYRRYSHFQTEGEITAKINIPSNQIHRCEKYSILQPGKPNSAPDWTHLNAAFDDPMMVSNIRDFF